MSTLIDSVKSLSDLVHYSRRQLPASPDGLTGSEAAPAVLGKRMDHGKLYDLIDDIQAAIKRGSPIDLDDGTVVRTCLFLVLAAAGTLYPFRCTSHEQ